MKNKPNKQQRSPRSEIVEYDRMANLFMFALTVEDMNVVIEINKVAKHDVRFDATRSALPQIVSLALRDYRDSFPLLLRVPEDNQGKLPLFERRYRKRRR